MGLFSNYYMYIVHKDSNILHLKRSPTWKSLLIFLIFWGVTHFIYHQTPYPYLGYTCYVLGIWFSYIGTEKYEECIFDKRDKTVTMLNARFLEKHLIGYRKKFVSELSEIIGATIVSVKPTILGEAHQIVILYITGLTLSVTATATYGKKRLHQEILDEIKDFLELGRSGPNKRDSYTSLDDKKND